ncbi:glutathione S-transferase family protein [Rhodobacteraceae bacterium HSP-20]|uniref:Glutathione S-transferase family protein n=1 Tax=Paragemmobacter amnigenus TaxID=2852097 RepID=A0ABS6J082_9RHOB|nr:glutathione S-transferase family protein [Rhodobacter amnigenus]MBU9696993.1 glutathione S-transferase family protein [Rhodobacter amnigenus]MBV4388220.1 glutathione S-transferase family protein [Rhodobacter amnigenus]
MILYDYVLSPDCYKVRLLAALTGAKITLRAVDFHPGAEHRKPEFLKINPAGTIPVMEEDGLVLTDSSAILTYVAAKAGPEWLGDDDARMRARVAQWLAFAQRLSASIGKARTHDMLQKPADIDACRAGGIQCLREIEAALVEQDILGARFLAGDRPTLADIACFPHSMLAPDGGISVDAYPAIRLWTRRIRALPGFVEMPGIHRLHDLKPEPAKA